MHPPLSIDPQHLHQFIPPFRIGVLQLLHHTVDGYIGHEGHARPGKGEGAHAPIGFEVGAVEVETGVAKGVEAEDGEGVFGVGEVFAGD